MSDFEIARTAGKCFDCGREIAPGEEFYSALFEMPEGFERRDYAVEHWQGPPEGSYCHYKTRLPTRDQKKKTFVDDEVLVAFFHRLADSEDPVKLRFRFVLSLILLRKRLLKYERTIRQEGGEFWDMRLMRDKSVHRVFNPLLNDDQIAELTAELGSILAGQSAAMLEVEESSTVAGSGGEIDNVSGMEAAEA